MLSILQQWHINRTLAAEAKAKAPALTAPAARPIAAIATPPGRGGIGVVRVSGRAGAARSRRRSSGAVPAAAPRHLARLPSRRRRGHRPGPGDLLSRAALLHRRGRARAAGARRALVMRELLARCVELGARLARARRVHRARVPQRQARSRAGRERRRPDRRRHRGGGALRGALAGRRVLARDRTRWSTRWSSCACMVEATLDFPEEEIDFLRGADARRRGSATPRSTCGGARARRAGRAAARRAHGGAGRASPTSASRAC